LGSLILGLESLTKEPPNLGELIQVKWVINGKWPKSSLRPNPKGVAK